jgi:DnaJ like chaperone protein
MNNALKLQVIHYLYGIAASDGEIHKSEIEIIEQISLKIGLTAREHNSVKSMFVEETIRHTRFSELANRPAMMKLKKHTA